ncbi:MAG: conjugal transfer protein TrbL, partial [Leifsonia sp.]
TIFLAGLALSAAAIVWFSLLVRKSLLLVAIVFAPLAFSGASWDATKGWIHKWSMFVIALIVSKLVLVVMFLVAVAEVSTPIDADLNSITDPIAGVVIMGMAAFAPYLAYKFISFVGFDMYHAIGAEQDAKNAMNRPLPTPTKPQGSDPKKVLDDSGKGNGTGGPTGNGGDGGGGGGTPPAPKPSAPSATGTGTGEGATAAGTAEGGAGAEAGAGAGAGAGAAAAGPAAAAVVAAEVAKKAFTAGPKAGAAVGGAADGHADAAAQNNVTPPAPQAPPPSTTAHTTSGPSRPDTPPSQPSTPKSPPPVPGKE